MKITHNLCIFVERKKKTANRYPTYRQTNNKYTVTDVYTYTYII